MIGSGRRGGLAVAVALAAAATTQAEAGFDAGRAPFGLRFGGAEIPYEIFAPSVRPGDRVTIEVTEPAGEGAHLVLAERGFLADLGPRRWSWQAPLEPSVTRVAVIHPSSGERVVLHVLVLVPFEAVEEGRLNGYRIGRYPPPPADDAAGSRSLAPAYATPPGFVEVTPGNESLPVSPHFRLGDFLCKQDGGPPRYLVLEERLLVKLEGLLEALNRSGVSARTLAVLSAFRTPDYNEAIGNVRYSRHQWGQAADVFVDENGDGRMDDLNGDGRTDLADALVLHRVVESLDASPEGAAYVGGLGAYPPTRAHGGFVHVDVRGRPARWGPTSAR